MADIGVKIRVVLQLFKLLGSEALHNINRSVQQRLILSIVGNMFNHHVLSMGRFPPILRVDCQSDFLCIAGGICIWAAANRVTGKLVFAHLRDILFRDDKNVVKDKE